MGQAINYTLKSWHHLQRFTTDARIWLDNNATERALRGPVVGGSLCTSHSNTRNHEGFAVGIRRTWALAA